VSRNWLLNQTALAHEESYREMYREMERDLLA